MSDATPHLDPISTLALGEYLLELTWANAQPDSPPVEVPKGFSTQLVQDCHHLTNRILEAYRSPHKITLTWSIEEYAERLTKQQNMQTPEKEDAILRDFPPVYPPGEEPLADTPVMVVDNQGIIVLWYLPGALTNRRATSLYSGVQKLNAQFAKSTTGDSDGAKSLRKSGFAEFPDGELTPGEISMSPAWHAPGHEHEPARSSPILREKTGKDFLKANNESLALLAAAMWPLHPQAADRGGEIMNTVRRGKSPEDWCAKLGYSRKWWPSPFTAMSIISNKESAIHRDARGFAPFYDLLATLGDYRNGRFYSPTIGVSFKYDPGTIIALNGKVLPHGVCSVDGNRVCIAQYFHAKVLEYHAARAGTMGYKHHKREGWMQEKYFRRSVDKDHYTEM